MASTYKNRLLTFFSVYVQHLCCRFQPDTGYTSTMSHCICWPARCFRYAISTQACARLASRSQRRPCILLCRVVAGRVSGEANMVRPGGPLPSGWLQNGTLFTLSEMMRTAMVVTRHECCAPPGPLSECEASPLLKSKPLGEVPIVRMRDAFEHVVCLRSETHPVGSSKLVQEREHHTP